MMRPSAGLLLVALLGACDNRGLGGNTDGGFDDSGAAVGAADHGIAVDLAAAADLTMANPVGERCPVGSECQPGMVCLDETFGAFFPPSGYCTRMCKGDLECGPGAFCSPSLGDGIRICLATCGPGGACPDGRVCGRRFAGLLPLPGGACLAGEPKARDGSPCTTFGDCNHDQACLKNPFSMPGGMCLTAGCTDGDNRTCLGGGDGICVAAGSGLHLCVDGCNLTADCRAAEKYVCTPIPGRLAKACLFPAAGPGARCKADLDCAPPGTPWRCLTGAPFPGGYCAGARGTCDPRVAESCPFDARCHDPSPAAPRSGDEHCARDCTVDDDCRKAEGYRCLPGGGLPMGTRVCRLP